MTILCHSCNASKGVNFLPGLVKPTLAPKAIIEYGNGAAAGGAGKGK